MGSFSHSSVSHGETSSIRRGNQKLPQRRVQLPPKKGEQKIHLHSHQEGTEDAQPRQIL